MVSFWNIVEDAKIGQDFWDNKKAEDRSLSDSALNVISRGLELRPDAEDNFWDDFVQVISNNSEDAAALLGVNRDIIASWSTKIDRALKKIKERDGTDKKGQVKATMLSTGLDKKD